MAPVPLTEGNNRNFPRGSPAELFLTSLVKVVSVPLTVGNNRNFVSDSPNELFFGFFGQQDRVATRQSGVWIDFHFSGYF